MKLLLDTHAFMWWDSASANLSRVALAAIQDPGNEVLLSVTSVWEMQVKSQLGKLPLRLPLDQIVSQQLNHGIRLLGIELPHIYGLSALPAIHKDPFDRLLVAQATAEGATLVTVDTAFVGYSTSVLW